VGNCLSLLCGTLNRAEDSMFEPSRAGKICLGTGEVGSAVSETGLGQQLEQVREEAGVGPLSMPVDTPEDDGSYDTNDIEETDGELEEDDGVAGPITTLPRLAPRQPVCYTVRATDLQCPICLEPFRDPFVTRCGHTYCYQCIQQQLKTKNSCPKCRNWLIEEQAYPNKFAQEVLPNFVVSGDQW
jgi:hypothetical protein